MSAHLREETNFRSIFHLLVRSNFCSQQKKKKPPDPVGPPARASSCRWLCPSLRPAPRHGGVLPSPSRARQQHARPGAIPIPSLSRQRQATRKPSRRRGNAGRRRTAKDLRDGDKYMTLEMKIGTGLYFIFSEESHFCSDFAFIKALRFRFFFLWNRNGNFRRFSSWNTSTGHELLMTMSDGWYCYNE